jgi:hypothetical protein
VCVTVTATWPKIGWIFHVFHESLSAMERKPSQDIGQCAFVYFSLKNNVGTTCISISTQGFVENMKISGFSLLKPFFTEKWMSEGAMERKYRQNRLPMYLCVFLIETNVGTRCNLISHQRRSIFYKKIGLKGKNPRIFMVLDESLSAMERNPGKIGSQCTFVYFSLKTNVGTRSMLISTDRDSLFYEKNGFKREKLPDLMVFDESLRAMERKSSENRLQLYLCLFPIKKEGLYKLQSDHHLRPSTFL